MIWYYWTSGRDFVVGELEELRVVQTLCCPVRSGCNQSDRAGPTGDCLARETGWPQTEPWHFTSPGDVEQSWRIWSRRGERKTSLSLVDNRHWSRGPSVMLPQSPIWSEGIQIKSCSRDCWLLPVRICCVIAATRGKLCEGWRPSSSISGYFSI